MRRECAPPAADAPRRGKASIDQTLSDMVAAYRDAGLPAPRRSTP
jgi:hypothetical protein